MSRKDQHEMLDRMVATFILETEKFPSKSTLLEFMHWSNQRSKDENSLDA